MTRRISYEALVSLTAGLRESIVAKVEAALPAKEPTALVVEPDLSVFRDMKYALTDGPECVRVVQASNAREALGYCNDDFWLVQISTAVPYPVDLCRRLRTHHPDALLVAATQLASCTLLGQLHAAGAYVSYPRVQSFLHLPALAIVARLQRRMLIERRTHEILSDEISTEFGAGAARMVGLTVADSGDLSVDEARLRLLQRALIEAQGNHSEAARALGVSRSTLYRWMRRAANE